MKLVSIQRTKIAYRDDVAQFFKYFNCNNESTTDVVYIILQEIILLSIAHTY